MWLPTKGQIDAASRHAITAAGVAVTIFGLQAKGVSMEQVTALISSLGETVNTLVQVIGAAGVLYGAVKAANSASPTNRIADVRAIATGSASAVAVDAQKALIEATSAVAQDKTTPASTEAKAALLDAVAAQVEVVGQINVTDQRIVDATQSSQIQKAA